MVRVITVEREYGSGGAAIAARLAKRLGWRLWDQLLTNEIARLMECDCRVVEEHEEKRDPLFYRLMRAFMRGSYEGSLNEPRMMIADTACIREVAEKVVKEAARQGECVIVGRGSAYYLQNEPDAFHSFIYAPFWEKVRRLEEEDGKSESEALQLIESVDRDRAEFIKAYFKVEWPERQKFHLMVNSTIGMDAAVETILNGIAQYEKSRGHAVPASQ
ncbi:MAG TPA: cytidylate kinase-like family protein [Patescibacteria group bacterium]|nr:cytidylate kinase-like family protein [Patescibacteria group bacterium]